MTFDRRPRRAARAQPRYSIEGQDRKLPRGRTDAYDPSMDRVIKRIGSIDLNNATIFVDVRSYNEQEPRIAVTHERIDHESGQTVRGSKIPRITSDEALDLSDVLADAGDELKRLNGEPVRDDDE